MKTFRLLLAALALGALSHAEALSLTPDAPKRYVVQAGDTLWSLAGKYLADPWAWGHLWHAGADIDNPNKIFPGDVLTLVWDAEGNPILTRESPQVDSVSTADVAHLGPVARTSDLALAVPSIPHDIAAAFMSRPTLVAASELSSLPYVVGFDHDRVAGAIGSRVYAHGVESASGTRFDLIHVGEKVKDPGSGRTLGYQAIYTGTARLDQPSQGRREVASLTLVSSARETLAGDRLLAEGEDARLDFIPHNPTKPVDARIASVIDGVSAIGQYHVVLLNLGRRAGLEPGHVLTLWHESGSLTDYGPGGGHERSLSLALPRTVRLPAEAAGSLLIFRTYPDASYALILETNSELRIGDHARSPQ